jgi:hypothetical protein
MKRRTRISASSREVIIWKKRRNMAIRSTKHWRESGNVFFTLFGAVALVGVIGAATATLMRGPVGTMVSLNQKTKVDAQMQIASKLAMLEASQQPNSGDCDSDGFVEPLPPLTAGCAIHPTGGGCIPTEIGSAKQDAWNSNYGYCSWDHGAAQCGTTGILQGKNAQDKPVIAIISAGPDRAFQTSCADDPTYVSKVAGSDDIILTYTYAEAVQASGGLWTLKSGAPGTATIDKNIDVSGTAHFQSGITGNTAFGGGAFNFANATGFYLPDQTNSGACTVSNVGSLRTNGVSGQVLQICDPSNSTDPDGDHWVDVGGSGATTAVAGSNGQVQFNNSGAFGASAGLTWDTATTKLTATKFAATGDSTFGAKLDVTGDSTFAAKLGVTGDATFAGKLDVTGKLSAAADLDVTKDADIHGNGQIHGNTILGGTLAVTGVSTLTGGAQVKAGSAGSPGLSFISAGSTGIYYSSGGIGISASGTQRAVVNSTGLDATGHVAATGDVTSGGTVAGNQFEVGAVGSGVGLFSNAAAGLELRTASTARFQIDAAGDIGIKIVGAPTADLDIGGVIRLRQMGATSGSNCGAMTGAITYSSGDQLLVCSSITNNWETIGTSGGGGGGAAEFWTKLVDGRLYYNAANVGVGTNDPLAKFHVNGGDFLVSGTHTGSAAMPVSGAGTRMVFDVNTGALRAGTALGAEWDDAGVGDQSIALGQTVKASAANALALGQTASATAANAFALGLGGASGAVPIVSGAKSFGIFMGDQSGVNVSDPNTMALLGGKLVIDPAVPATHFTTNGSLTADIFGDLGAINFCDEQGNNCFTASDIAGGVTGAPGNNREVIFNSGGILGSSTGMLYTSSGFLSLSQGIIVGGSGHDTNSTFVNGGNTGSTGTNNTLIGVSAGASVSSGGSNTAIGMNAGNALTIANYNTLVGRAAGLIATGDGNTYIGNQAGNTMTTGAHNIIIGDSIAIAPVSASDRLNIGNLLYGYLPTGGQYARLGVGTSLPVTKLDVAGTIRMAYSNETCDSSHLGSIYYDSVSGKFYGCKTAGSWTDIATGGAAAGNDREIQFNSGGAFATSSTFIFTSAGRLGIGTATPSGVLALDGNTSSYFTRQSNSSTGVATISQYQRGNGIGNGANGIGGAWAMSLENTAGTYEGGGVITSILSDATATQVDSQMILTVFDNSAAVDALLLDHNGRVGIGQSVPNTKLDVNGTIRMGYSSEPCDASHLGSIYYDSVGGIFYGCKTAGSWTNIASGGTSNAAGSDTQIQFNSGGLLYASSGLVYTSVGSVGIGATPAASKLTVLNNISVTNGTNEIAYLGGSSNHGRLIIKDSNGVASISMGPGNSTSSNFITTGSTGLNVGASTLAKSKLDVSGNMAVGSYAATTAAPANGLIVSGLVGIGTSSPTVSLAVGGTDAMLIPAGLVGSRPAGIAGMIRFNSSTNVFEGYNGAAWGNLASGGTMTAAGSDTQVQLNDGGLLYASSGFTYNSTTGVLTVAGRASIGGAGGSSVMITGGNNTSTGSFNLFTGVSAGQANTSGGQGTFLGYFAGGSNTTGSNNTAVGTSAFAYNQAGTRNTGLGANAGQGASAGTSDVSDSVFVGHKAGFAILTGGNQNTLVGSLAGLAVTTGANNVMLGYNAGNTTTSGGGNILIGSGIVASAAGTSNALNIGNLIYGNMSTGAPYTKVGIDQSSPVAKLDVNGTIRMSYSGEACDASHLGAIYYDSVSGIFYGCKAAGSWTNIASGGTSNAAGSDTQVQLNNNGILYDSTGLSFNSTSGLLSVDGGMNLQASANASSPGTLLFNTALGTSYGKILFEPGNGVGIQSGKGQKLQIASWHGIELSGGQGAVLPAFVAGGSAADTNVLIKNTSGNSIVLGVQGKSGQTADFQQWLSSTPAVLSVVDKNGKFGIGLTAPATHLDVNGTIRMSYGGEACDASHLGAIYYDSVSGIFYGCKTAGSWTNIASGGTPTPAGSDKQLQLNNNGILYASTGLTFNSSSGFLNVAGIEIINTTVQSFGGLQVANPLSSETSIGFIPAATATGNSPTSSDGTSAIWVMGPGTDQAGTSKFGIYNANLGDNVITLTSGGYVGVGTDIPSYPLQVGADLAFTGNWPTVSFNTHYDGTNDRYITTNTGAASVGFDYTNAGLQFSTVGSGTAGNIGTLTYRMFIKASTGYIGVGTNTPKTALDVIGALRLDDGNKSCSTVNGLTGAIRYNSSTNKVQSCNGTTWADVGSGVSATPAGSDKQVQLNNGGVLYASSGLTFNSTSGLLTLTGDVSTTGKFIIDGNAFIDNKGGVHNTLVGDLAGNSVTTGKDNSFFGYHAGYFMTAGNSDTFVGTQAGGNTTAGSQNTLLGYAAGLLVFGSSNTMVGYNAGSSTDLGANNTFLGSSSGGAVQSGSNNVFLGYNSGSTTVSGSNNLLIGYGVTAPASTTSNALNIGNLIYGNLSGGVPYTKIGIDQSSPVAKLDIGGTVRIGYSGEACDASHLGAMYFSSATGLFYACGTAGSWTQLTFGASGSAAGADRQIQFNSGNAFAGDTGMTYTTGGVVTLGKRIIVGGSGADSTSVMVTGGNATSTGADNVIVGSASGILNSTGARNTYLGRESGNANATGNSNTFIGYDAGYTSTGGGNTYLGAYTGQSDTTGVFNTMIGYQAQTSLGNLANATAIGKSATVGASNTISLGGTGADSVKVIIGGTTAAATLDVNGGARVNYNSGTCSSSNLGEIMYNSATNRFMGCKTAGSWTDIASGGSPTPAGSSSQIQFNSNGVLSGSSSLTWDGTALATGGSDFWLYNTSRCKSDGIGVSDPLGYCGGLGRALVHAGGDILVLNYGEDYDGGVNIGGGFVYRYSTTGNSPRVGINSATPKAALDVGGSIKLADGVQSCSAANGLTGAIRYNSATNRMQSCNGTAWADVGSGVTPTPAGSDKQIQLNNNGILYASSGLTFSSSTGVLTVANRAIIGGSGRDANSVFVTGGNATSTGDGNTFIGTSAGAANTSGASNTAIGKVALQTNAGGSNNIAIGAGSLSSSSSGDNNTAIGVGAMQYSNGAGGNVAIGLNAGDGVTGASNVVIGDSVGSTTLTSGSRNILIGNSSAVDTAAAGTSNYLSIGNLIYGILPTGTVYTKVGVDQNAPVTKLDVNGTIRMGYSGETCDASHLGSIYYSSTTNIFYACKKISSTPVKRRAPGWIFRPARPPDPTARSSSTAVAPCPPSSSPRQAASASAQAPPAAYWRWTAAQALSSPARAAPRPAPRPSRNTSAGTAAATARTALPAPGRCPWKIPPALMRPAAT